MKGSAIVKTVMSTVGMSLALFWVVGCSDVISATVPKSIDGESTALFIVYDDSGSMSEAVPNAKGGEEPKYVIADRALISVGQRFDSYLMANTNRTLGIGIVLLRSGRVNFTEFKTLKGGVAKYLKDWTRRRGEPTGGTPLGDAMQIASDNLVGIDNVKNKHIVILTDGGSNQGAEPQNVLPNMYNSFKKTGVSLGVHLVAFDVSEGIFSTLKSQGATVLGASNEVELNKQFDFILREKIMLEREE